MEAIVDYLCSDQCLPRVPGRPGGAAARDYLEAELSRTGLDPAGEGGYRQSIPSIEGANLVATIPGSGSRADRCIILAAHYDACDPFDEGMPGAGDNAAAVAVVLQTVRTMLDSCPDLDRSVLVCLFDSEEPPYFLSGDMGSQWFVDHPTVDLDRIDLMICLDLVGHALGPVGLPNEVRNSIFVLGAELSDGTGPLLDELPPVDGIFPRRVGNHIVPAMSDYHAFLTAGIPFVFYTAGRTRHYHAITDTPGTLDYTKMAALAEHLALLAAAACNRTESKVVFRPEGNDDVATVGSLRAVLQPLAELTPLAARALGDLDDLAADAAARRLDDFERGLLAEIVFGLEEALG